MCTSARSSTQPARSVRFRGLTRTAITVVESAAAGPRRLPRFDERGELVERHPGAELVVGRGDAGRKPFVLDGDVCAAIRVGKDRGDRHLALQGGVRRLELEHL